LNARYAELRPVADAGTGDAERDGAPAVDPETRYLFFGDPPISCGDPLADDRCGHWRVTIVIPPALYKSGELKLDRPEVSASYSYRGPANDAGDCYRETGPFTQGSVFIGNPVDFEGMLVSLRDTRLFDVDADGLYFAGTCFPL
jgi:hypothetical protein